MIMTDKLSEDVISVDLLYKGEEGRELAVRIEAFVIQSHNCVEFTATSIVE